MKRIICITLLSLLLIMQTSFAQTPSFDSTININQSYTSHTEIFPFDGIQMYGAGINGTITLNSDTSIVKIILRDSLSMDYLIFETNSYFNSATSFSFSEECEETCFMNGFVPTSIELQIVGSTVLLNNFKYCSTSVTDATTLQHQARTAKINDKIDLMNDFIQAEGLIWVAGETSYLNMYYNQKKELYKSTIWTPAIEYYVSGFFGLKSPSNGANITVNYDYVDNFEWRNRHGANDTTSNYFDGNNDGSGWVTKAACQNGCWTNDILDCSVHEWQCTGTNSEWRSVGTCWAFGPASHVEALVNLYLNQHFDVDLSEQNIVSCCSNIPRPVPWFASCAYNYFESTGVVDEDCFPYTAQGTPCNEICTNPDEKIKINNYNRTNNPTQQELREAVMQDGSISAQFMNCMWGTWSHTMLLVGWDVIEWGDENILGIPPDPVVFADYVGCTYWIYKQNYGNRDDMHGYQYLLHENDDTPELFIVPTNTQNFVSSVVGTFDESDIACLDNDGDGYYNWGIGQKPPHCPPCPDEPDGDDNNSGLGPLDDHGFCTIINTYNSDFENTMNYWKQSDDDDCDWIKYSDTTANYPISGPAGTPDGSTHYIYMNASICYLRAGAIIESPPIALSDACAVEVTFAYHKNNYTWGNDDTDNSKLAIDISYDGGQNWINDYWYVIGDQEDLWHYQTVTLPSDVSKIRFNTYTGIHSFYNDIALDDITIGPASGNNIIISADTEWSNQNYVICGDIIIEPNATLTIGNGASVFMQEDSKIIVKRVGHLIVDDATITAQGNVQWHGIQVWGNSLAFNIPIYQGWVQTKNGCKIMNSTYGIYTNRPIPDADGWMQNYTGGIVQISETEFKNNKVSIRFYPYNYSSLSYLSKSSFIVDDDYFSTIEPTNYVDISGMRGVDIINCDFKNETGTDYQYRGVTSINSTIFLKGSCTSGTTPCSSWDNGLFENLEYGVYATASTSTPYADISHTEFVNNRRGVYLGGITNPRVISNEFSLNLPYDSLGYGLYLDESTDYWVEDNVFEHPTTTGRMGTGIIVNQSGEDPNEIYLNVFNNLEYAINVQGENRSGTNPDQGLVIKCNQYNNTGFDETIIWEGPWITKKAGIAGEQGFNSSNIEDMAGNIFHYETSAPDFDDLHNQANHFDYYFSLNAGFYDVEPMDATWNTVDKWEQNTGVWTHETGCEPGINTGGSPIEDERSAMNSAQTAIETTESLLAALVDGGDTEALNAEVETSSPPGAVDLYNELMGKSPSLSETVVESSIEKENVLPNAMLRDVMVANPHTAKSEVLLTKLDERFDPLPDYMKAQIIAGRSIQNLKQELESQLAYYELNKAKATNTLIRYYTEKIEDPQAASDSLLALFQANNTIKNSYRLAWLYFSRGEYQSGENVLNNIPGQYSLDDDGQQRHTNMVNIYTMLAALYENGNTNDSLNAGQLTELQTLATDGTIPARAYARNILLAIGEMEYDEPVLFPNPFKSSIAIDDYNELLKAEAPQQLSVYPNPSRGYVILEYKIEPETQGTIRIKDMAGNSLDEFATTNTHNQVTLVCKGWKPGVYIASLNIDGKTIESIKFTLLK